ncbi:hypothetical protein BRARA_H00386 [Brassica rapa]|uniref:Uncharacterized protein n=1 Tax=Brassica campestris TaxID=3711 RepID=A0A397Y8I1_BRACM|nr:hypothetical protein BRARA_H00386 [Brassica rapa]
MASSNQQMIQIQSAFRRFPASSISPFLCKFQKLAMAPFARDFFLSFDLSIKLSPYLRHSSPCPKTFDCLGILTHDGLCLSW